MKKFALAAILATGWLQPASSASYDNLNTGIYYYNQGQWSLAVAELDKALAPNDLAPNLKFIALLDRGEAKLRMGQGAAGINDLSASLAVRPGDPRALMMRILARMGAGKVEEAKPDLDLLIEKRSGFGGAYALRAILYAKLGQLDKSTADMQTMVSMLPDRKQRGVDAGIVAWQTGDNEKARESFAYAVRHDDDVYGWLWLTIAELRLGHAVPLDSLPSFDKEKWPAPIVSFFTGASSEEAVFTAASQAVADDPGGRDCEANFYVGEWRLLHQDKAGAKGMMEKAAKECPTGFREWIPAQMEAANLHG